MKYSDCCGAAPRSNGDSDTADIGICPVCGDHCDYLDDECPTCHGTGEREITIGGYGWPEADVPVVCDECNGSGKAKDSVYDYLDEKGQMK